jgi:hypothetical protein
VVVHVQAGEEVDAQDQAFLVLFRGKQEVGIKAFQVCFLLQIRMGGELEGPAASKQVRFG